MSYLPSKYQSDIFSHIKSGKANGVVEAVAGSGKSTTLVEAMKISGKKDVAFVAFNKHIAEEMKGRVPDDVRVTTMHSFGLDQLRKVYGSVKVDPQKVRRVIKSMMPFWEIPKDINRMEWLDRIISLSDLLRLTLSRTPEDAQIVAAKHSIITSHDEIQKSLEVIRALDRIRDSIDFVDMVYIPAIEDIKIQEFPLVLVDECQDLSNAQIELLLKMRASGLSLSVGDRNQAIYGFGGADDSSFEKLASLPNTSMLPLSICYRCSKSVIQHAKEFVPHIEPSEWAETGDVILKGSMENVKDGSYVLCRTTAPLIKFALLLIADGKKVTIKGVDIGDKIISTLKSSGTSSPAKSISILEDYYHRELESTDTSKNKNTLAYLRDMIDASIEISKGCNTIDDVKSKLDSIFSDTESQGIILMTIHKSKGLESDYVHILRPDLLPLKTAKLPWEITQERNLQYVAITRAKKVLSYIDDFK